MVAAAVEEMNLWHAGVVFTCAHFRAGVVIEGNSDAFETAKPRTNEIAFFPWIYRKYTKIPPISARKSTLEFRPQTSRTALGIS